MSELSSQSINSLGTPAYSFATNSVRSEFNQVEPSTSKPAAIERRSPGLAIVTSASLKKQGTHLLLPAIEWGLLGGGIVVGVGTNISGAFDERNIEQLGLTSYVILNGPKPNGWILSGERIRGNWSTMISSSLSLGLSQEDLQTGRPTLKDFAFLRTGPQFALPAGPLHFRLQLTGQLSASGAAAQSALFVQIPDGNGLLHNIRFVAARIDWASWGVASAQSTSSISTLSRMMVIVNLRPPKV